MLDLYTLLLNINNYNLLHKTRDNNKGGGVAILIKSNIKFEVIDNLDKFNKEIIGIKIELINKKKHCLFSYYNSPDIVLDKEIFENIEEQFENYLICGDFNARSVVLGGIGDNSNGAILEQIVINSNGLILNEGNEPTFHILNRNCKPGH